MIPYQYFAYRYLLAFQSPRPEAQIVVGASLCIAYLSTRPCVKMNILWMEETVGHSIRLYNFLKITTRSLKLFIRLRCRLQRHRTRAYKQVEEAEIEPTSSHWFSAFDLPDRVHKADYSLAKHARMSIAVRKHPRRCRRTAPNVLVHTSAFLRIREPVLPLVQTYNKCLSPAATCDLPVSLSDRRYGSHNKSLETGRAVNRPVGECRICCRTYRQGAQWHV